MLPLVVFLGFILGYPIVLNIIYSFSDVTFQTIRSPSLLADNIFSNYSKVIRSGAFWQSFGFSLRFALLASFIEVALGLVLAVALEPLLRKRKFLLIFILLPLMIAPVLMGVMYRLLLNDFVGMIPKYFQLLGLQVNLLNPPLLLWTLLGIEILQWTPFAFLIIFAGLQGIPDELIDAGKIDGATSSKLFRHIVLPCLLPSLLISIFIRFVDSFRVFDHIYVLTGGGPGNLTTSMSIYIYKSFFQQEQIGLAVAASMVLMLIFLAPLVLFMKKVIRSS